MVVLKMGVASIIRSVLNTTPKECSMSEIPKGGYFEYDGLVCVKFDWNQAVGVDGSIHVFGDDQSVRPLKVTLEYDYKLITERGTEFK